MYHKLNWFVNKYKYNLLDSLTFNSYRTGQRSEVRDYDSISVTEILSLIEDPNMEMVKIYYSDKLKEAQKYGTTVHKQIEESIIWEQLSGPVTLDRWPIAIQFKLFCMKNKVQDMQAEQMFSKQYKELPLVTGTIDAIALFKWVQSILDWKVTKWKRNFKSIKYHIQAAWYRWLTGIPQSMIVYLSPKDYSISTSEDIEYYDALWLELLDYADSLYINNKLNNLYDSWKN